MNKLQTRKNPGKWAVMYMCIRGVDFSLILRFVDLILDLFYSVFFLFVLDLHHFTCQVATGLNDIFKVFNSTINTHLLLFQFCIFLLQYVYLWSFAYSYSVANNVPYQWRSFTVVLFRSPSQMKITIYCRFLLFLF
jgi:uncharacterized membrane protein (UPF0182 family)